MLYLFSYKVPPLGDLYDSSEPLHSNPEVSFFKVKCMAAITRSQGLMAHLIIISYESFAKFSGADVGADSRERI